jgi:hypothetical protein
MNFRMAVPAASSAGEEKVVRVLPDSGEVGLEVAVQANAVARGSEQIAVPGAVGSMAVRTAFIECGMLEQIRPGLLLVTCVADSLALKHVDRKFAPVDVVTVDAPDRAQLDRMVILKSELRADDLMAGRAEIPPAALCCGKGLFPLLCLPVKRLRRMAVPAADFARVRGLIPTRKTWTVAGLAGLCLAIGTPSPHFRTAADVRGLGGI